MKGVLSLYSLLLKRCLTEHGIMDISLACSPVSVPNVKIVDGLHNMSISSEEEIRRGVFSVWIAASGAVVLGSGILHPLLLCGPGTT
jgi:hypothetical protein